MELNAHGLNEVGLNDPGASGAGISRVTRWHEAGFELRPSLQTWHDAGFALSPPLQTWHENPYGARLLAYHTAIFGSRMGAAWHAAPLNLRSEVAQWHAAPSAVLALQPVVQWHASPFTRKVGNWHASPLTINSPVAQWHASGYTGSVPVENWRESAMALLPTNPVQSWHRSFFDFRTAGIFNISGNPYILKNGVQIAITGADLSCDEGGYAWICNISLARTADYQAFEKDDPFTLVLFGDSYEFIRDGKSLTRSGPSQVDLTVSGISPCARLEAPRAEEITKTWVEPIMASAVALELADGIPVDWQLVDWLIPAYRLGVSKASPLSVIQQVAQAAGGLVEAKQDGSLLVRPKFRVSVPNWETTAPDQTFTDAEDNLSIREGVTYVRIYDRFFLSDTSAASGTDRFEFHADEGDASRGKLLAYPATWRTNLAVTSTRVGVLLVPLGVETRDEEEVVEFVQGVGQTRFPIDAILSSEWLDADLGGLAFEPYASRITSTGSGPGEKYSLLRLRYRTKAITYHTEYAGNGEVQYLLEEI